MAWIYVSTKVDTHQEPIMPFRQIADICRRRGGSGCGGVSAMDGATEATWMYLRRPPQPDPPRHPRECPLLTLLLPLIRQVQGAALPITPTRFAALRAHCPCRPAAAASTAMPAPG
ncbi:hypothetical protein C7E25_07035 [Stenotrophomonas maltophilia]|nr:hypothetical protein C7E24_16105 [Stenotrophomonas maltophilia]PSD45409.1 hypothetical protein C7E24_16175 [Stenotrophomonas maltophilia]PSD50161.1 hypothetical protein C7E25_07035 [Stenotrophomonas maltophilia]